MPDRHAVLMRKPGEAVPLERVRTPTVEDYSPPVAARAVDRFESRVLERSDFAVALGDAPVGNPESSAEEADYRWVEPPDTEPQQEPEGW